MSFEESEENIVGLMFFRHGCDDPDGIAVEESEARKAIKHYADWMAKENEIISPVWASQDGNFAINLEDVALVRYGEISDTIEEGGEGGEGESWKKN